MIETTDLGTYVEHAGRPAVRFVRTYQHPIERVWSAITETDELRHWFPSTARIELRAGGTVTFSDDPHMEDATGPCWPATRRVGWRTRGAATSCTTSWSRSGTEAAG